jgi:hypothetical protein
MVRSPNDWCNVQEDVPLLKSSVQRSMHRRRPFILAVIAFGAVVTLAASIGLHHIKSRTVLATEYNLPDGVEPVDQLSFTRAVKAHEMGAKKLDDVASRF